MVEKKIALGVHLGNMLYYTAQHYSSPPVVLRETVQNALDKEARHIFVKIDQRVRIIEVYDDGLGAGESEISKKFENVGQSLKLDEESAIGEKGIGNLAGIAIAEIYELITKDVRSGETLKVYRLDRSQVKGQRAVNLDVRDWGSKVITTSLSFTPTTLIRLREVDDTALRRLRDLETIEQILVEAFNVKLGAVNVQLVYYDKKGKAKQKNVKPVCFRGIKMAPPEAVKTEFGTVIFELFFSQKPLAKPQILIQHGNYTVPLFNLFKLKQLDDEAAEKIWRKGYFEGTIHLPYGTLNASRTGFDWDKPFGCFADTFQKFTADVIAPLVENSEDSAKEDRYRKIAEDILEKVKKIFQENPILVPDGFRLLVKSGRTDDTSLPVGAQSALPPERKPAPDKGMVRRQREKIRKNPKPVKKKEKRVQPKAGIRLVFVNPTEEEPFNWHSRVEDGAIQINAGHPDFVRAEQAGVKKHTEYVFLLCQKELTCALVSPVEAKTFSDCFERKFLQFYRANV